MSNPIIIGNATLYLGDCQEILPSLPKVDAVITDPPYGLGDNMWKGGSANTKSTWKLCDDGTAMEWDRSAPTEIVCSLPGIAKETIIWGGNYFPLEPRRGWLIWDKVVREFTSGHAEIAWTTLDQPIRAFNSARGQVVSEGKEHPTQKPLRLMKWCIDQLSANAQTILDPFMGSGTTGVACMQMGRSFIGIEKEPRYFDIACRRIDAAQKQADLFGHAPETSPSPPQQLSLLCEDAA